MTVPNTFANVTSATGAQIDANFAAVGQLNSANTWTAPQSVIAATAVDNPVRVDQLMLQSLTYITTGGTSTAYTLTPVPALAALTAGHRFSVIFNATAGATPTLSISGLTAKALKFYNSSGTKVAASAATIISGMSADVEYDGTDYVVKTTTAARTGTITNDAAGAGVVGEYVESVVGVTSAPTSGQYGDLTSISLTAGNWDISCLIYATLNTATGLTAILGGIGTATGNNGAGLVVGDTKTHGAPPVAAYDVTSTVPSKKVSIAGTTTYYLKMLATYSGGTPQFAGRLSARRAF